MFSIQSEKDLRDSFREQDQGELFLPTGFSFPRGVKDYLTWLEPSGARIYLVFKDASFKAPFGIVFRRDQSMGPDAAAMCDWCHSVRSGNQIGLLSVSTKSRHRVGISLCRDLTCVENVRSGPGVHDFPRYGNEPERAKQVLKRITEFVRRELI